MEASDSFVDRLMLQLPFDVESDEFLQNPYRFYEQVRRTSGPLHRTHEGQVVVLGYAEATAVLRDPRFGHGAQAPMERTNYGVPAPAFVLTDPPGHTCQRERVRRAFTAREILSLHQKINNLAADLTESAARSGTADIVADIARPLSAQVVADLIGVPEDLRDNFVQAAELMVRGLDPPRLIAPDTRRHIARARIGLAKDIAVTLKRPPDMGLLHTLSEGSDGPTARAEIIATCAQLVAAGYETTVGLIGNGMHALLQHPDQMAALTATAPSEQAIAAAVEEILRFDPPFQMAPRSALVDADIAGTPVQRGTIVSVLLGAANRDPHIFSEPHQLRLDRQPRHLAFGLGSHYCLGAALARLQATAVLTHLLPRWPRPAGQPVSYRPTRIARSILSLYVRLDVPKSATRPKHQTAHRAEASR
ncbi:cytochrome P450 [Streptomyces sp. NPDC059525]|uniref:cytochrome P450 n=1 Tax=Streptomyces sp. NPDC059525 TaxID=3346857 RepID=UPI0036B9688B